MKPGLVPGHPLNHYAYVLHDASIHADLLRSLTLSSVSIPYPLHLTPTPPPVPFV